jgi:hypothetical protein
MEELRQTTTIPKELLNQVTFQKADVLQNDPTRSRLRNFYLNKAQSMGNLYKHKVKLYFKTAANELLAVETTIWSADEEYITVKGGSIPTKAVFAIEL